MLQVRLLGQFDVRAEGKRVPLTTRAAQSLFAYLVLNAHVEHRREKLAGLLWLDSSEENARKYLRQELWRIRKAIASVASEGGEFLRADEISVSFAPAASFWLDVALLEMPESSTESLVSSLSLYRGELLPGFYDDWILLERERVQSLFETKMEKLLEQLTAAERWSAAQEWAEKWLAHGDTPEPAYRALMLAYGARGDMGKVSAMYERCAQDLREQLGVEPSAETRALYDGLLKGAQAPLRPVTVQPSGTVTFLFTDIEGSTRLLERLRDNYALVLEEHHAILRAAIQKWNGHEVETQGDAFFVTFARALDAVQCAVDAQRALAAHTWIDDAEVRVRMGLHTGEPLVATTGYVGMDVHRAARIGDAGHGGQVLLSQTTRELIVHELPPDVSLRDLGEHRLKDLKYPTPIFELLIHGLPQEFPPLKTKFTGTEPPIPGEPPFKGLQYFDVDDADLFFGRERLTERLVDRLRESHFLSVVIGASGSGKSSLVRAGLVPALKQTTDGRRQTTESWRVFVMTPMAHPLEALAMTLTRESESVTATATLMDDLARDPRSLHLFLGRQMADHRPQTTDPLHPSSFIPHPLLVVDQFEELFTLCRDELEREQFIDNLVNALGQSSVVGNQSTVHSSPSPNHPISPSLPHPLSPSLSLVLTLRADFYARLSEYPELRDLVAAHQEYIGPMSEEELRRAMEEPARRGHWEFEPGLVDLILRDVGDEPGALPLLSHALLETWKRRAGHTMTLKGYADAGGVRGAIAHTAESVYENLSPDEQNIARNIFVRLTELGEGTEDTRRRAEIGELETGGADREQVREVLTKLADARLITTHEHNAEVAHEALIREWSRLREWLNENRDGLKLHRALTEAANEWELLERDASVLYRGARLAQAREFANVNSNALNAGERAFLDASEENEKRETREREEQQQRELRAAQKLAITEQRANKRLRQRAIFLAGAFMLALLLAGIALFFGNRANENARAAAQNAHTAEANAAQAQEAKVSAEKQQRIATARELAANAVRNLSLDPQLSILLALQALKATEPDKTVLPEAEDALHRAVMASHVQGALPFYSSTEKAPPSDVYRTFRASISPDGLHIAMRAPGVFKILDAKTRQELLNPSVSRTFGAVGLAFNADGSQVATLDGNADAEKTNKILVKVFDTKTGQLVRQIKLAQVWDGIFGASFSPDLSRVVLIPYDDTIHVWDTMTGQAVATLPIKAGGDLFPSATFSPDGKRVATATSDSAAKIFDAATGKELMTLCCHAATVANVAFSPDGTQIATAGWDLKVKLWDAATGKELNSRAGHSNTVTDVVWSPDGKRLASTSWDRKAIIWDAQSGKLIYELPGHTDFIYSADFSPDGKTLITASGDQTAMLWDVGPSRELGAVEGPRFLLPAGYSTDRTRMYSYDGDGTLKIWDTQTLTTRQTLPLGHTFDGLGQVALSPDEKLVAFTSFNPDDQIMSLKVWDLNGKELHSFGTGKAGDIVWSPKFSPDGSRIAIPLDNDNGMQIGIWNIATGETVSRFTLGPIAGTFVEALAWSPDGTRVLSGNANGMIQAWDANTGAHQFDMPGHTNFIWQIVYSPDGNKIASASRDGLAIIYDAQTGKELVRLIGHTSTVDSLDWGPDGKYIVTAGSDGTAKLWDVASGTELVTFNQGVYPVEGAIFTADGKHVITTSDDGAIRYFTLDTQELIQLAKARLIRTWRPEECQKYLHVAQCPHE